MSDDQVLKELRALRALVEAALTVGREAPRLYSLQEAARLLGVSPKTVGRMVAAGELVPVLIRGRQKVPRAEIDRLSAPPRKTERAAPRPRYDGVAALAQLDALTKRKR